MTNYFSPKFFKGRKIQNNNFFSFHLLRCLVKVCVKAHIIREKKQAYVTRERDSLNILRNTKGIISLNCTFQGKLILSKFFHVFIHFDLLYKLFFSLFRCCCCCKFCRSNKTLFCIDLCSKW